jgi:hypothetical protein
MGPVTNARDPPCRAIWCALNSPQLPQLKAGRAYWRKISLAACTSDSTTTQIFAHSHRKGLGGKLLAYFPSVKGEVRLTLASMLVCCTAAAARGDPAMASGRVDLPLPMRLHPACCTSHCICQRRAGVRQAAGCPIRVSSRLRYFCFKLAGLGDRAIYGFTVCMQQQIAKFRPPRTM